MRFRIRESKQVGILYHFCNPITIDEIINQDVLRSYFYSNISFTRNSSPNFTYVGQQPRTIFRLVIDGDKLSNNYAIRPYSDSFYGKNSKDVFYRGKEEQEEIVRSPIKNVSRFILHIDLILDDLIDDSYFMKKRDEDKFFKSWSVKDFKNVIRILNEDFHLRIFLHGKELKEIPSYLR